MRKALWFPLILLIIATTSLVHTIFLDLSFDELIQYDTLFGRKLSTVLYHIIYQDHQLPFQYLILHPLVNSSFASASRFFFRFPSLVFGFSTLVVFFQLSNFFLKETYWRYVAFALLASNIMFIELSANARPYSAMLLFFTFSLLAALKNLEREINLFWVIGFILSLSLLASTHYYGILYAAMIILGFLYCKNANTRLISFILGLLSLLGALTWLSQMTINFHPQKTTPSLIKLMGVFSSLGSGVFGFSLLVLLSFFLKTYRKPKFVALVLLFASPIFASLVLSYMWRPLFEYRFFYPGVICLSLLLAMSLEGLSIGYSKERKLTGLFFFIGVGLCIQQGLHAVKQKNSNAFPHGQKSTQFIIENIAEEATVVACGNCPSFYFNDKRLACLGGWNFKKRSVKHPAEVKAMMIFTMNNRFCLPQVPSHLKKIKSFDGVDLYSTSKKPL